LGVSVPTSLLFDLADIAQLAKSLVMQHPETMAQRFGATCVAQQLQLAHRSTSGSAGPEEHPLIARLKVDGSQTPIFMVHPPGGIVVCYRELAGALAAEQPLYAIRSRGLHAAETLPQSLAEMAADYVAAIKTVQPAGPYVLGGWSLGGLVAYEMAQQLLQQGEQVRQLILLDTTIPVGSTDLVPAAEQVNVGLEYGIELSLDELAALAPEEQLPFLWQHAQQLGVLSDDSPPDVVERALRELQGLFHHHVQLSRSYRPLPLAADVLLIRPREVPFELQVREDRGWSFLARSVQVRFVAGHHHSMVQQPHVQELAAAVQAGDCRLEAGG
jgi:thioesterase domain-containing protein